MKQYNSNQMPDPRHRVQVVEDDPADAKVLQKYLADFFAHSGRKCNVEVFGDSSWPDASMSDWGVGADYDGGKFWKSLGKYSSVSPEYPQLNWE